MATSPSPVGAGGLNSPPQQPPASQPPSPPGMGVVGSPASAGLSAAAFPQEVMQTVSLVKDSLTHLVALLPPLAPFVSQSLDQLIQMTQAIVLQSSAGPPQAGMGGGASQPMAPPQGAGTPPPGM